MIDVLGEVLRALGQTTDAASSSGSAIARLGALAPLAAGQTGKPLVYPNLANAVNVGTGAGAWGYGSYGQLVAASVLASHSLLAFIVTGVGQDDDYQVMVATGGAGSEVDIAEFGFRTVKGSADSQMQIIVLPNPVQIPVNARVAYKCASKLGGASVTGKIWVQPRPLA